MTNTEKKQKLTLKQSQKDTLEILSKLDKICKKLDITYWIMYGTLIGAVRHNGFIPWDDDFDVAMPRKDYNKLLKYFYKKKNFVDGLYLDNYLFDKTCFFCITRICDKKHILEFKEANHKSGLFIDIYPFDGMGNEEDKKYWEHEWKRQTHWAVKMFVMAGHQSLLYGDGIIHKLGNLPFSIIAKLNGRKPYYKKLIKNSRKYSWDESEFVGEVVWPGWLRFLKKEWFSDVIYLKFENITVPAPIGYDKILRTIYGDYMELPPIDKRKPQHDYIAYKILE